MDNLMRIVEFAGPEFIHCEPAFEKPVEFINMFPYRRDGCHGRENNHPVLEQVNDGGIRSKPPVHLRNQVFHQITGPRIVPSLGDDADAPMVTRDKEHREEIIEHAVSERDITAAMGGLKQDLCLIKKKGVQ